MKKSLLIFGLMMTFVLPVCAELSVQDTVSADYMLNQGYSKMTVDATQKSVSRANGEKSESNLNAFDRCPVVKFIKSYIDPAADVDSFMNHDINTHPRWDDL